MITTDEIADRLTAFPKHSHSSRFLQPEGELHSGILALCQLTSAYRLDGMTANDRRKNHTVSIIVAFGIRMIFERNKKQLTFGDDHEIEFQSTRNQEKPISPSLECKLSLPFSV